MRLSIIAFALVLCLGAAFFGLRAEETAAFEIHDRPEAIIDGVFLDGTGHERHLSDLKGRTTVLNLWATWCGPCVKELPSLDRLQAKIGSDKFQVVVLSLDRGGVDAARAFFAKTGIKHLEPDADPTTKLGFALSAPGLPTTLILDSDGKEIARVSGPMDWDSAETIAALKRWIKA